MAVPSGSLGARCALAPLPLGVLLVAGLLTPLPTSGSPLSRATSEAALQTGVTPGQVVVGPGRVFPQTGYRLGRSADDPFGEYFVARGGVSAFGYPVSRPFVLRGLRVQVFQRAVLQESPMGVALLNLLDGEYLPYTDLGTAVIPPVDPAVAAAAPAPGAPEYGRTVAAHVAGVVPDTWRGRPVGFLDAYLRAGLLGGAPDPALQALVAVEVLGFPTSGPAFDPRNPDFVYQRFQRAVLQYDAAAGLTQPLLMGDYLNGSLAHSADSGKSVR